MRALNSPGTSVYENTIVASVAIIYYLPALRKRQPQGNGCKHKCASEVMRTRDYSSVWGVREREKMHFTNEHG